MAGSQTLRVVVRILADGKQATREVKKTEDAFSRLGSRIGKSLVSFAAATASIGALVAGLRSSISAFLAQEQAVQSLDSALQGLGPSAEATSRALQEQAEALQQVTRFGDEAIINAQALLATFGVAPDQLGKATQATVDLAEALGISLESAARNVGRTVGGFAGELGEVIPELKALDAEALKAGAGIDLLATKFAGRAVEGAKSFSGELAQLSNALGDFQEDIGRAIAGNEAATESINALTDAFNRLGPALAKTIVFVGEGLAGAFQTLTSPLRAVFDIVSGITGLFVDNAEAARVAAEGFDDLEKNADRLGISVEELKRRLEEAKKETADFADEITDEGDAVQESAVKHRDLVIAFDELIASSNEWQRAISKNEAAVREDTEAVEEGETALEAFERAQRRAREAIDQTTDALEDQAQAARRSSQIVGQGLGGEPLFEGLTGATYSYTIRRAAPSVNGGVQFFNAARGRRII